jgi:hypothetical protein
MTLGNHLPSCHLRPTPCHLIIVLNCLNQALLAIFLTTHHSPIFILHIIMDLVWAVSQASVLLPGQKKNRNVLRIALLDLLHQLAFHFPRLIILNGLISVLNSYSCNTPIMESSYTSSPSCCCRKTSHSHKSHCKRSQCHTSGWWVDWYQ